MVPQTVAFDEGPSPQPLPDYEWYVVGPRTTPEAAKAITDAGSKLIVKIQPVRWFVDGKPYMNSRWDRILSTLPMLPNSISLEMPGEGMGGSRVIDFADTLAMNLSGPLLQLAGQLGASGVMFDYGCRDVGWVAPGYDWGPWGLGYAKCRRAVAAKLKVWNCCNKDQGFGLLMLENIQPTGSDTSYPPNYRQVWDIAAMASGQMLLIQNADPKHRRILCGIALATGGLVNYRPGFFTPEGRWVNEIPEEMRF